MQRLLAFAILIGLAAAPSSAWAARDATAEEAAPFQSLTRTKACISGARISTYDGYWATTGASPCEPSSVLYVLHQDAGVWSVVFIDDQYAVRACPIANVPDPVAIDLNLCNPRLTPTPTPRPVATPVPSVTPRPTATPSPTPAPAPGTGPTGSTPGAPTILCLPSGDTLRIAKVRPRSCNTLGPDDSFAEAVNLGKLNWKGWGLGSATATGVERGFHLPASKIKVKVTASGLKANDCGGSSYTKLKVKSKYGTHRQTLPATCGD